MKKFLLLIIVVMMIPVLGYSQIITVTNPNSRTVWEKGTTKTITWTRTGETGVNVKINIFKDSIDPANFVGQLTGPNTGSKSWPIPASYGAGRYILRIKGVDASGNDVGVYGDSALFQITESGGSITVNKPVSGETVCKGGEPYTIRWTRIGETGVNVKINIFKDSIDSANFVGQLTGPNTGSKSWPIPASYGAGRYILRIKGVDASGNDIGVHGDSALFNISACLAEYIPRINVMRDFEIKDIYYIYNRGGWIVARIKNNLNNFNGDLKFRVFFPDEDILLRHPLNYTKYLNMRAGAERVLYLVPNSLINDVPFCGKRVSVRIDPDNEIRETKENNNNLIKRIYIKKADLIINAPRSELKIKKAYLKFSYKWRVMFKIHVKAGGAGYSSLSNVYVRWSLYNGRGRELYSHGFDIFSLNHNEEKVLNVNKKFGHPGKHRSVRPRLSEGRYYIIVRVSSRDRLCETNMGNNRYRFSIHLH
jgi:hypothetical protein